jgi:hypothetical protein
VTYCDPKTPGCIDLTNDNNLKDFISKFGSSLYLDVIMVIFIIKHTPMLMLDNYSKPL